MGPLLLSLTLSALPCGLSGDFLGEPCATQDPEGAPLDAGVPAGLLCFELTSAGNGREAQWVRETTWLDPSTCALGRVVESGGAGSPLVTVALPAGLPKGVKLSPALQAPLTARVLPPRADPKDPAHALARAHAKLPRGARGKTTSMPALEWWPGPVPPPRDSATPSRATPEAGTCPCQVRFAASRYRRLREWSVGTQTLSVWGNGARNQDFLVAVTDAGGKRHRWIHRGYVNGPDEPFDAQVEGDRWYLPVSHFVDEELFVLGYDAKTGQAWQVNLPDTQLVGAGDAGVELRTEDGVAQRAWSSLGPRR